jgi:tetratricopeptide (TPR) repeat protein
MQTRAKRKRFAFTLPNELWTYMFVFLDIASIGIVNQLCKQFKTSVDTAWRQIFKRDFPFGYDVYNIEDQFTRVNFKQTYQSVKTRIHNIPVIPANITLTKALEHHIIFLQLIGYYGQTTFCGRLLDNLFCIYKLSNESQKQTLMPKLEQFLKLFQSYQLHTDYICVYLIGLVLHHVFGNKKEALVYYKIAIPLNNSFGCVVEIIHCIDEPNELQEICESYCKVFPTRKYAILFALANRLQQLEVDKKTILPIALKSLKEYDQKQPDTIFIHPHQDAPKLDILKLIGDLYNEENSEALVYYRKILDSSPKCSIIFKFDVTIKTVTILYNINNTIKEAFGYLYTIYYDCGFNEQTICFEWMMKYIDKYVSDIVNPQMCETLSNCVKKCKQLANSPMLRNFVDMYQVIIHYFQGNYGLGVSEFGHSLNEKNQQYHIQSLIDKKQHYTRYIGKCYLKMGKYDDAQRIFDLHTRDASILMDIALLYLELGEPDKASAYFLESKTLPPTIDFDYLETLQFLEKKFSK